MGYWEAGVGDRDNDGCESEIGDGDWDRAEGGLRAEAESSENLCLLCLLSGLWLLQLSLLLCCSLLLSSLMMLGFMLDAGG